MKLAEILNISVNTLLNNESATRKVDVQMKYDVVIVGAGPGGIFAAYELMQNNPNLSVAVFEAGHSLDKRKCPIDGEKIKNCINCKICSIMSGFGGAGAFSDGKYNITNDFGGTLYEYIGKNQALDLMKYVDQINLRRQRHKALHHCRHLLQNSMYPTRPSFAGCFRPSPGNGYQLRCS